jgi:hypothetical protein
MCEPGALRDFSEQGNKILVSIRVRCLHLLTISHEYAVLRSVILISNIFKSVILYEVMKPVFLLLVF